MVFKGKDLHLLLNSTVQFTVSSLWVIDTCDLEISDENELLLEKTKPSFEKKLTDRKRNTIVDVQYPIKNRFINKVKAGDNLIEIYSNHSQAIVIKPQRALGVTVNKKTGKAFLRVEAQKRESSRPWKDFEKHLRHYKILNIRKRTTREITNENSKVILLDFFN